jgi:anti-sigma-K factor RskA
MGLATDAERLEFERACAQYPEVRAAREAFELALEQQAFEAAQPVPASWKAEISRAVLEGPTTEVPVVPISTARSNPWKWVAAASILLLAGSMIWNFSLLNKQKETNVQLAEMKGWMDTANAQLSSMEKMKEVLIGNENLKMATMKGMDPAPQAYATVYWDSLSKDVYLMVNNLPAPASGKQYQLWAILNGQPVDLGVIPNDIFVQKKSLLLTMKNTLGAQAFAITLEKMGGNPTPEGQMYTLGNL